MSYYDMGLVLAMFNLGQGVGEEIRGMVKASGLPPKPSPSNPSPKPRPITGLLLRNLNVATLVMKPYYTQYINPA